MFIECIDECRVQHGDKIYLFEETARFGYIYKVDEDLAKAAVATGKCVEKKDYKGSFEIPSSTLVVAPETPPAAPAAPKKASATEPAPATPPATPPAAPAAPPAAPKSKTRKSATEGG